MPNIPSYPEDAPVEGGAAAGDAAPQQAASPKRKKQLMSTGVAVGIGSAAIVAALLYANRSKRGDRENS